MSSKFRKEVTDMLRVASIKSVRISPASPWQNGSRNAGSEAVAESFSITRWIKLLTAAVTTDEQQFRITHPFHPLQGQAPLCVASKQWAGERQFIVRRPDGSLCLVPASWTDFLPPDPYLMIGQGRSHFRVEDLVALADLLRGIES